MKLITPINGTSLMLGLAGIAAAAWLLNRGAKAATEAVGTAAEAVNPVNNDNIFYQGVNAVGEKLTGRENFDLGTWIYDITHGD